MNKSSNIYLDTSAVLKLLTDEDESQQMKDYFNKYVKFHMLSLCFVETLSTLKRKYFHDKKTRRKYFTGQILYSIYCKRNIKIHDVTISDIDKAFCALADLVNTYNIDFIDAYQINHLKKESLLQRTRLITADSDLEKAARTENLDVWNCVNGLTNK